MAVSSVFTGWSIPWATKTARMKAPQPFIGIRMHTGAEVESQI